MIYCHIFEECSAISPENFIALLLYSTLLSRTGLYQIYRILVAECVILVDSSCDFRMKWSFRNGLCSLCRKRGNFDPRNLVKIRAVVIMASKNLCKFRRQYVAKTTKLYDTVEVERG